MQEKLFALDIGTRTVVGIILERNSNGYSVLDILSKEHSERAMLDGQIHDVVAVSRVIEGIKAELKKKHGPLNQVSVAAAGRALKTERAKVEIDIKGKPIMQREDILHLELTAVQKAQGAAAGQDDTQSGYHYYCVGYSVLYYHLDDQEIGNLIDQSGEKASVEIIATFLPKVVVESLLAALKRADLTMQALTLEPIAAINVLIPASMRRLNIALVDIGAGTSDIALTDAGTVIAYGMVPVAGDEITEAISDALLLDFPMAETVKRQLNSKEDFISVTDILGFSHDMQKSDVITEISGALERLAGSISDEILSLNNGNPPKAVMLVGGGSLTPDLPGLLANKLSLPANRVAIRDIEAIQNLVFPDTMLSGPEFVTPVGIAIAADKNPVKYLSVTVNNQTIRLFDMKKMTVGDCLLTAGIKLNKLYGKPGMAMIVQYNGKSVTIPGTHGSKPELSLNSMGASLADEVSEGDVITVIKGQDGMQANYSIAELADHIPHKSVSINGERYIASAELIRNGQPVTGAEPLGDHDVIECKMPESISSLLSRLKLKDLLTNIHPFTVQLDDKTIRLPAYSHKLKKNGMEADMNDSFEDGDELIFIAPQPPEAQDLLNEINCQSVYSIPISFNGKKMSLSKQLSELHRDGEPLGDHDVIKNGDILTLIQHKMEPFIFQDLFRHVEIEMPQDSNGRFILIKNNKETSFHETVSPGDELKILWPTAMKNF
ncbi:cell division protein FtsA [Peribacillus sp. B-H-3]|uniref:cell division protein FtsA n=1 Tax=Peribacillus sp. B-H-3 TaxID=3400420 RepID=UPI003B02240A